MPPFEPIMISDDEPDPQRALSRDMEALDEKMNEVNKMVVELGIEVSSYTKLLRAAQSRLDTARQQKEQLVDEKHKLLDKKQKLMQLSVSHKPPQPLAQGSNHVISDNANHRAKREPELEPELPARSISTAQSRDPLAHPLTPAAPSTEKRPKLKYFAQLPSTRTSTSDGDSEELPSTRRRTTNSQKARGRGRGSRRSYGGGGLSGVRASIRSRAPRTPSEEKEQSHQRTQSRKSRAHVYSPYYEASSSESESEASLSRKKNQVDTALATKSSSRNIPVNPKTFSRKEISSIIGGRTQGTWCNVNPNKATTYFAGPYMALDRGLNHLLPEQPGQNGGVYVGDWLRKEVGKTYQIFIKKTSNNWLYYGKYIISSIREVGLAEWREFQDTDKNRWAEHMLEHQWGKNILLKKKLMTEGQCIKHNWEKVLGFFNRTDNHPNLRLKVLALSFLSYDAALYDALNSMQPNSSLGEKRRYSDYDEDGSDSYDWIGGGCPC